jgi:hypothetical protein
VLRRVNHPNVVGCLGRGVDEATGRFVVVYEPRRTHRDKIRVRVIEIGREQGLNYDPIFDDR